MKLEKKTSEYGAGEKKRSMPVKALTLHLGLSDSSYTVAVITAVLLFACCFAIREPETKGDKADSEKCTTGAEIARTI